MKIVIIGVSIGAIVLCIAILLLMLNTYMKLSVAKKKALEFYQRLEGFRERAIRLRTHALDYSITLASQNNRSLLELNNTIAELESRVSTVLDLIETGNISGLSKTRQLLSDTITPISGSRERVKWEDYLENLIQTVGEAIYKASQSSKELGLSSRGKKDTVVSLMDAGIDIEEFRRNLLAEYENENNDYDPPL